MRQHFQQQGEEQWAKDRALMHTNSHAKLRTILTIDPHMTLGIAIRVHALDDTHSPFIDTEAPQGPQQDLSWHMIPKFLKVDHVDEVKIERFVRGDVLLLQLANNLPVDGVSGSSTRHKAKLHLRNFVDVED